MLSQYSSRRRRIILAIIKYLGNCLCPLCTCPKEKVRDLGLKADDLRRGVIQVDSEERQMMVQKARDWIFKTGHAVTSDAIDEYLKLSVIPIRVMFSLLHRLRSLICNNNRMHSRKHSAIRVSTFIKCSLSIFFMTLNLVSGKAYSHI